MRNYDYDQIHPNWGNISLQVLTFKYGVRLTLLDETMWVQWYLFQLIEHCDKCHDIDECVTIIEGVMV